MNITVSVTPLRAISFDTKTLSIFTAEYSNLSDKDKRFGLTGDLSNQRVLDVGCGLGGTTIYYAERGAYQVIGIEISPIRASSARALVQHHPMAGIIHFVIADAARLPFRNAVFDSVMSTDAWEHMLAPEVALLECARVAKPEGRIVVTAVPFFSPWGAHAKRWLPIPWIQVICPRHILFSILSTIEQFRKVNEILPESVRIDWTHPNDPAHAQRLTVAVCEKYMLHSGLKVLKFNLVPIGLRYGRWIAWIMRYLVRWPVLRELLTGFVVIIARKPRPET